VRAYRVRSRTAIAPFGDEARDLYVGTETIAASHERIFTACGVELEDVEDLELIKARPAIVFFDDVYFTEMALRQFLADAMGARADVALAMPDSAVMRAHRVLDDERPIEDGGIPYDVFAIAGSAPLSSREALRARCRPIVQSAREARIRIALPIQREGQEAEAPFSARIVAHVRHWVHLLRLSELSVGVSLLDRLRKSPGLLLRLRLMRGRDPWEIARKISFVDPTARVHPTADLECAIVGPGAVIRAHAHVHRSVLGANVHVGDHAVLVGCTLAEQTQVLRASYFALCASMPKATLASYKAQLSLFGREVFLTSSAWMLDAKLRGDVSVEHAGRKVSIGTPYLGACLGHRVTLGAQVTLLPGRAVPNGVTVVAPPGLFAGEIPSYPEGALLAVRDGRLVPFGGGNEPGRSDD
jgi:acetyltransferase-like isoleucine patch superfamily enzyme